MLLIESCSLLLRAPFSVGFVNLPYKLWIPPYLLARFNNRLYSTLVIVFSSFSALKNEFSESNHLWKFVFNEVTDTPLYWRNPAKAGITPTGPKNLDNPTSNEARILGSVYLFVIRAKSSIKRNDLASYSLYSLI